MNKEKTAQKIINDLERWAMGEYGVPLYLAQKRSRGADAEFNRLNRILHEWATLVDDLYRENQELKMENESLSENAYTANKAAVEFEKQLKAFDLLAIKSDYIQILKKKLERCKDEFYKIYDDISFCDRSENSFFMFVEKEFPERFK